MDDLTTRILREINKGDATFANLEDLPGFGGGEAALMSQNCAGIMYWAGMSHEGCDGLLNLHSEGLWHMHHISPLAYVIDGRILKLPLAKKLRPYKQPHWLPAVLKPGLNCPNSICSKTIMKGQFQGVAG